MDETFNLSLKDNYILNIKLAIKNYNTGSYIYIYIYMGGWVRVKNKNEKN